MFYTDRRLLCLWTQQDGSGVKVKYSWLWLPSTSVFPVYQVLNGDMFWFRYGQIWGLNILKNCINIESCRVPWWSIERRYTAVMALSIENVSNWEVNISGYCSHIISVIGKRKLKKKNRKKIWNLTHDSNLTRDLKLTRATNKLSPCYVNNFDAIENGRGWLGPFNRPVPKPIKIQLFLCYFRDFLFEGVHRQTVWSPVRHTCPLLAGEFPSIKYCHWKENHETEKISKFGMFVNQPEKASTEKIWLWTNRR